MARKPQNEVNHFFGTEFSAKQLTVRAKGGGEDTPSCFFTQEQPKPLIRRRHHGPHTG